MKLFDELKWRGLIKDITSPELEEKLNAGGMTFYIGTDPTADSMHIGHLSSFLISKRLADAGHHPIHLIGGATGRIGDPRPTSEREMKSIEEIEKNIVGLTKQAKDLFGFEVVNNYDWSKDINFMDFLRDYGKYFNVNYMLDKDIIRRRLETGITYTEFSYMIMQALDFWWLSENKGVTMQVAGQDQWGNMTAGIELCRRKANREVYAFTMPLLTKSDGTKFGKTNGKAVWLDINKTSAYEMYQFFINSEDSKIIDYLKFLTFLSKEEIEELERKHLEAPHLREAHKALAKAVITFLHGEEAYNQALATAQAVFSGQGSADMPTLELKDEDLVDGQIDILSLLVKCGFASSKGDARRTVEQGGASIDNEKVTDVKAVYTKEQLSNGLIVRKGKKNFKKVVSQESIDSVPENL